MSRPLRALLALLSGALIGASLALLLWVALAGPARSVVEPPAPVVEPPHACAQLSAPAWCADLPPEQVQQQLPEETTGRAYG